MQATPEKPNLSEELPSDGRSSPLNLVRLAPLMDLTSGIPKIAIGLIDGPVASGHPGLNAESLKEISQKSLAGCSDAASVACVHGTFVAGILIGRKGSDAPAVCPGCSLLVRPIFAESGTTAGQVPSAAPAELASAILDVVRAGARVINLSLALLQSSTRGEWELQQALDLAARKAVISGGRRRQPGNRGRNGHHKASVGNSGGCLRFARAADGAVEFGELDWAARRGGPRRESHES